VVKSRFVAELFEMRHDHVLRDIDEKVGSSELRTLPIKGLAHTAKITSLDPKANREVRSFDMTRDDFTLLAMG
jgi:anti-repressor protein